MPRVGLRRCAARQGHATSRTPPPHEAPVLIDLQEGVARQPVEPYSATAVVSRVDDLVRAFRATGAPCVLVRVEFSTDDGGEMLRTDVALQLRRRGIATIVLGSIATNMGVESTARAATNTPIF